MSVIRDLQEQLAQVETAQFVTTMLRDISATRLQSIRLQFEANKAYYQQLHGLMEGVKRYAQAKRVDLSQLGPDRGRIYVAITANKRFYGNLNTNVMDYLYTVLQEQPSVAGYVLGQTGLQYVEAHPEMRARINSRVCKDDEPTPAELHRIIIDLEDYTDVIMIHPTFINSFRQEVKLSDITHVPPDTVTTLVPSLEYLCEPELPELLAFFRTHIRLTLAKRVLLETRVALTGARLMKMQRARERSVELVREQQRIIHKEMSTIQSMRLLETGVSFHREKNI
jgi:F0F1-type ATP synthase gamma subunit